ncbi:putative polysaccharide deacetylase YxkH [Brochothrix thermosphacta]|uniref:polysaccharide deacetylase family protein n=1 Tax=Brochothrix thermosphacta TaxID=2756 RepID=UPI000D7B5782|nr:polysaccharide deacetylase family protein [Brochothrix thermosphacta]MDO7863590.1 polysaccharide deacetylase family protein [Brochothrix thermosphacta]SPP27757.1 putative polysaccharide deacetylase YxkH [Brochothrix thermosphacta]
MIISIVVLFIIGTLCYNNFIKEKTTSPEANTVIKKVATKPKKEVKKAETVKWIKQTEPVKIPILMYHSISTGNSLRVPPAEFKQQMAFLKEAGYYTLTPAEMYKAFETNSLPSKKVVLLTFDDGYTDNYTEALPILAANKQQGTIFMITDTTGKKNHLTLAQMQDMIKDNITIESHTVTHQELNSLKKELQLKELSDSKLFIKQRLKHDSILVSYPVGRYNENTLAATKEVGYKMAVTTEPGLASKADGYFKLKRVRVVPGLSQESYQHLIENGL